MDFLKPESWPRAPGFSWAVCAGGRAVFVAGRDAFGAFRQHLRALVGQARIRDAQSALPVLLIHEDSNLYSTEPFGGSEAPNLWRLNGWGDFQQPADATLVTVHGQGAPKPFSARTLLGNQAPADGCTAN
ncbi:MAG: hypothetical protein GKR94_20935 [Gammaproteobacteria bacterium]|nr:hypothetical protein [Gammaproteobacteria bacterium]